jgi:PhzF family phenazine biosynthesis protein
MKFYIIDSFANEAFKGNPAAVVLQDRELSDEQYLEYSSEFNLSETAFVSCQNQDFKNSKKFNLKWFTPTNQVNLCGHDIDF